MPAIKSNDYTAKEAINLLEGRFVKREYSNGQQGFTGIDFNSPKDEYNNHKRIAITKKDSLDVASVVKNSALVINATDKYSKDEVSAFLTKSLEKGNLAKTSIDTKDGIITGYTKYDPFTAKLDHYDDKIQKISDERLNSHSESKSEVQGEELNETKSKQQQR